MTRLVAGATALVLIAGCATAASPSSVPESAMPSAAVATATVPPASAASAAVPGPTPTDRPRCPHPGGGQCLGQLAAGTYSTIVFRPTITYTVPAGWGNYEDLPGNFLLVPPAGDLAGVDAGTSDYLGIYAAVALQAPCSGPAPVAAAPAAMAAFVRHQAAYAATLPRDVSVGGLSGVVLDIRLARSWKVDCFNTGAPVASVIAGLPPSEFEHGIGKGLAMRLYLLTHGTDVLAIEIDDVTDGRHLAALDSVARSLQFGP